MKNYRYGLYMGGFALVPIVLSLDRRDHGVDRDGIDHGDVRTGG